MSLTDRSRPKWAYARVAFLEFHFSRRLTGSVQDAALTRVRREEALIDIAESPSVPTENAQPLIILNLNRFAGFARKDRG